MYWFAGFSPDGLRPVFLRILPLGSGDSPFLFGIRIQVYFRSERCKMGNKCDFLARTARLVDVNAAQSSPLWVKFCSAVVSGVGRGGPRA